jgi:hypothetical protein
MPKTIPNKSRTRKIAWCWVGAMLLAAPAGAQSVRARLLTLDRAVADSSLQRGFGSALAPHLEPRAILLYPDGPVVQGVSDIATFLSAQRLLDSLRITWQPAGAELSADSSLGATWGVGVVTTRGGRVLIGRYLTAWERTAGGPWRIAAMLVPDLGHDTGTIPVPGMPLELPKLTVSGTAAPFVEADLAFSRLAGDSGATIAFQYWAAPDAQMASGAGLVLHGPEAIGTLVSGPNAWRWHAVAAGAAPDGTMGWTVGQAVISSPAGETYPTKYITIWRNRGGAIRFVTDGGNGRAAGRP